MIHKGQGPMPDKKEVKEKLVAILEAARAGSITPGEAVIECENVTMSIREARRYLGLPNAPIIWG